jgi:hypothetical protein
VNPLLVFTPANTTFEFINAVTNPTLPVLLHVSHELYAFNSNPGTVRKAYTIHPFVLYPQEIISGSGFRVSKRHEYYREAILCALNRNGITYPIILPLLPFNPLTK